MTTGYMTHPIFLEHDTGAGHPERAARLRAVAERIASSGLAGELDQVQAEPVDRNVVRGVHAEHVVERAARLAASGGGVLDGGDTVVSRASFDAALTAVGAAVGAVDRVLDGEWQNAFVACRPPGHHAEADRSMGFCLFNNAALAAVHALARPEIERVAVVDWDVHHGNGTQHIFEDSAEVFYASLHQWPWYPGTGAATERGRGDGEGATLNLPMASGSGDDTYLRAVEDRLLPSLEAFDPQLVVISAGFDAHVRDPLSGTLVTEDFFARTTELLTSLAGGRVVSLLEGGYDLDGLAASVEAHVGALVRGAGAGTLASPA